MLASIQAYPPQRFLFFHQPAGCIHERRLVPRHGQCAAVAVAYVVRCGCLVICNHRQSRGHGFEHHVAEGLGQAREQEQVAAGIVLGQHLTTLGTTEHCIRYLLLEG